MNRRSFFSGIARTAIVAMAPQIAFGVVAKGRQYDDAWKELFEAQNKINITLAGIRLKLMHKHDK